MGKLNSLQEAAANLALSDYFGIPISEVEGLKRAMAETRRQTLQEAAEVAEAHGGRKIARQILALSQKGDEADG